MGRLGWITRGSSDGGGHGSRGGEMGTCIYTTKKCEHSIPGEEKSKAERVVLGTGVGTRTRRIVIDAVYE